MAVQDLLSQDEIDALLHGVDDGLVETETDADPTSVKSYDLTSQDRIVRGKLPTLEMINERFARTWRIGLFNLLRRSADLSVRGIDLIRFGEYMHSLQVPTNLNLVKMKPLRGTALVMFEPRLVFTVVDNFFGGSGKYHTRIEGREFTPTEMRVIQLLLRQTFSDLVDAWAPVMPVDSGAVVAPQPTQPAPPVDLVQFGFRQARPAEQVRTVFYRDTTTQSSVTSSGDTSAGSERVSSPHFT